MAGVTQISNETLYLAFVRWMKGQFTLREVTEGYSKQLFSVSGTLLASNIELERGQHDYTQLRSGQELHVCPVLFHIWQRERVGDAAKLRRLHSEYINELHNGTEQGRELPDSLQSVT